MATQISVLNLGKRLGGKLIRKYPMKYRIIESDAGLFFPQFKEGFFRTWKMFSHNADTSRSMLVVLISERDPIKAAQFHTEAEAAAFIERLVRKVDTYWADYAASRDRALDGVKSRRVIDVNK